MRFTYIVDEKVSGRYGIMKKDYKVADVYKRQGLRGLPVQPEGRH